jgi:hypothetical protein
VKKVKRIKEVKKEKIIKEDGRYLIYYSFDKKTSKKSTK